MNPEFRPENMRDEILSNFKPKPAENEPTPETTPEKQPRFNWVAFIVMIIGVGVALGVGLLIPGFLDEYIVIVIINLIYGFVQVHGFRTPRK